MFNTSKPAILFNIYFYIFFLLIFYGLRQLPYTSSNNRGTPPANSEKNNMTLNTYYIRCNLHALKVFGIVSVQADTY